MNATEFVKDDFFKGVSGNIYLSFVGQDIYPSFEEKVVNLL